MTTIRRLATKLLSVTLRHSSPDSHEWAHAMLRELDFIENEWVALLWALGSTTAICRHAMRARLIGKSQHEEEQMNQTGKRAIGIASGIGIAVLLAGCAFGLLHLSSNLFPALGPGRLPWIVWLLVVGLVTTFIVATISLWRKRRPMAVGILLTAIPLCTHFVMHIASHWNR